MSSAKQIAANRENARRSTGPKTLAGKTTSSRNALKHGLLSAQMLLPDEDPKELSALAEAIHEQLAPEGEMEQALADRVVACLWRLRRVHGLEGSLYRYKESELVGSDSTMSRVMGLETKDPPRAPDPGLVYMRISDDLAKLSRYETTIERGMYQALHELQRLQAERGARQTAPAALDVDVRVGE